ncbi:hypothetical protein DSUL_60209 [Desulfovibrionales bacterium]
MLTILLTERSKNVSHNDHLHTPPHKCILIQDFEPTIDPDFQGYLAKANAPNAAFTRNITQLTGTLISSIFYNRLD